MLHSAAPIARLGCPEPCRTRRCYRSWCTFRRLQGRRSDTRGRKSQGSTEERAFSSLPSAPQGSREVQREVQKVYDQWKSACCPILAACGAHARCCHAQLRRQRDVGLDMAANGAPADTGSSLMPLRMGDVLCGEPGVGKHAQQIDALFEAVRAYIWRSGEPIKHVCHTQSAPSAQRARDASERLSTDNARSGRCQRSYPAVI